ncbi:hypothetical protein EV421DRAFT_1740896 [Armillaria borealis]|uniref:Hydrophobin n=1 Tax=Armillaria borealis TaxID=47425 RepID=A0AA39J433_9AGAR|nr:hypothetical protein EV421DRAFT_1740896 [Armillaria borealis]
MRSILTFGPLFPIAALLVSATAITTTSCYDKGDLVECCQSVEPANSTLIAEKGIQAGDLANDELVGFNCTNPEGDVVEGTSRWHVFPRSFTETRTLVRASCVAVTSYSSQTKSVLLALTESQNPSDSQLEPASEG